MEERLNQLLNIAIKYGATDIHFELRGEEISINMRIEGSLRKIAIKQGDHKLIRYLMYLANMDVGNTSMPQSSEFELEVNNNLVRLRFAIIQSVNQTSAVLRLLNRINSPKNYENNDGVKEFINEFNKTVNNGCGLYVISGPTGSGKTTLAYNILKSLKNRKTYSLENPIEIYCDNIIQIQINENVGLDYVTGIKQVLRHNLDVLFVSEIRDSSCANAVLAAAATGHTVITTMHAGSCKDTVSRLIEYGVDEDRLKEQLKAVINLRLFTDENGNKELKSEYMKGEK